MAGDIKTEISKEELKAELINMIGSFEKVYRSSLCEKGIIAFQYLSYKLALAQLEEQSFESQLEKDGRVYVIISAKHMANDRGRLIFWGSGGATKTEEKRSFGGYTCDISKCERYTREEVLKGNCVSTEEATKKINWKKMFKSVDSFYIRVDRLEELTGYRAATSFYQ